MELKKEVLDRIERELKQQGKTLTSLCRYLEIATNSGTEWRAGRSASYMKKLPMIADYLGVTTEYLIGKTDSHHPANDDELLEIMNAVHKRPELRVLFSASKNATKDDILRTVKIIESLKGFDNE